MKVDELIKQLENYKECEIDFLQLNGDKLVIDSFWKFQGIECVTVVLKKP